MTEIFETADAEVSRRAPQLSEWCSQIFDFAEPAWREYRSVALYAELLRKEGFEVEEGSAGMPTAFAARWSNGQGPHVGMYAEYDAVPANCQAADVIERPRDGLSNLAAGHTDPHSGLGIGSLGGLLAAKAAMEKHDIKGTLRFTGEPAEKVRGSKPIHAAKGYYDGLDAMLSFHPFYMLPLCNTVRWDTHCGAAFSFVLRFKCEEPETWGAGDGAPIPQSHSDIRAPGATDALVQMYQAGRSLRDSILPHRGGWSISEAIISAGQATADNLPGRQSDLQYMIRTSDVRMAEQASEHLMRIAENIARLTHCRVERHWVSKSRPGIANHALSDLVWGQLQEVGPPTWSQKAHQIAGQIEIACGQDLRDDPLLPETKRLIDPREAEAILRRDLAPSQRNSTSDDYTDMCWHAPTARLYIARPTLAPRNDRMPWPAWAMNAMGGIPELIDPMVQTAAKVLARSALRILTDQDVRTAMRSEFEARRAEAIPPLCDYDPPLDFAWPEYVETPRGRDWHISG